MENNKKQIKAETNYMGMNMKIYSDFSMDIQNQGQTSVSTYEEIFIRQLANNYKGVNRIYKPIALLFWTDVKNGKLSNWKIEGAE